MWGDFAAGLIAVSLFSLNAKEPARAESVALSVRFKLTNLDYRPIEGAKVRLVLGSTSPWQQADAGKRFTTDAKGEHRFETRVMLEPRSRKRPTNFMDSLTARPQPTDLLHVAAELDYAGRPWRCAESLSLGCDEGSAYRRGPQPLDARRGRGHPARVMPRPHGGSTRREGAGLRAPAPGGRPRPQRSRTPSPRTSGSPGSRRGTRS